MKQVFALLAAAVFTLTACEKNNDAFENSPRTDVPGELQGLWMHGEFSTIEYWDTDPATYMGNGLELAFAFDFHSDGTYTQYFTSSSVIAGGVTYQQSVTTGTVEVNPATHTIITHPVQSHYKRTRNGHTEEELDKKKNDMQPTRYTYTTGTEPSGTNAIYLTLEGTTEPWTFLQKD